MTTRALLMEYPVATSHEGYTITIPSGTVPPRCLMGWTGLPQAEKGRTSIRIVGPTGWLRSGHADHIQEALEAEGFIVERKAD